MQYVDGGNAEDAVRATTMTAHRGVYVIGEIAKALDCAHKRGLVHRDIKPANFLLSASIHGNERVLLGDFGIARALDDATMTATGSVLATLSYAAPITRGKNSRILISPRLGRWLIPICPSGAI
jgi:eukaryotic-like serine/threonine-protein kinase